LVLELGIFLLDCRILKLKVFVLERKLVQLSLELLDLLILIVDGALQLLLVVLFPLARSDCRLSVLEPLPGFFVLDGVLEI
jgi:hypothetical protein